MTKSKGDNQNSHFYQYNDDDNIESVRADDVKSYQYQYGDSLEFEGVKASVEAFTTFTYNNDGEVSAKKYGEKDSIHFSYDFEGRIRSIIHRNGDIDKPLAEYSYDDQERTVTISNLDGKTSSILRTDIIQLDFNGNPMSIKDTNHNRIENTFDMGNFIGKSYNVGLGAVKEKSFFMVNSYTETISDSEAIRRFFFELRGNSAFADFRTGRNLIFRNEEQNLVALPYLHGSSNLVIERENGIDFLRSTTARGLVYHFQEFFSRTDQSVSFWFRINNANNDLRRQSLFSAGRSGATNNLEVSAIGTNIILRLGDTTLLSLNSGHSQANQWTFVSLSWQFISTTQASFTLWVNGQRVSGNGNRNLNVVDTVYAFGNNLLFANVDNPFTTDIAYIVMGTTKAQDVETIRTNYNVTKAIFGYRDKLPEGTKALSSASHFLENPRELDNFHLFPYNGTLNSTEGFEPADLSLDARNFVYDAALGRSVYLAVGSRVRYNFNFQQNQGTIGLKFKIEEHTSGEQTIFAAQAETQTFQLFRNASGIICFRLNNNAPILTTLTANLHQWHTISFSWRRTVFTGFTIILDNIESPTIFQDFIDFRNMTLEVGNNSLITNDLNPMMGRVCGLLINKNRSSSLIGREAQTILTETVKKVEVDSLGLPQREIVGDNGNETVTKNFTYSTRQDQGRSFLTGNISNESIRYGNQNISFNYQYSNGKMTSIGTNRNDETLLSRVRTYRYDYRDYLEMERDGNREVNYSYDGNGNMISAITTDSSNQSVNIIKRFEYNNPRSKDLLTDVISEDQSINIEYHEDYLGIPKLRTVTNSNVVTNRIEYEYQGRRLISMKDSITKEAFEYKYDANGLRISKKHYKNVDNGVANEVQYYYDGDKLITEFNDGYRLDFHYDQSGLLFAFTHTAGLIPVNTKYYYLRDALLNIIGITDASGNIVCEYKEVNSWGNHVCISPDGTQNNDPNFIGNLNSMRYKGYFYDCEANLYYLQSRFYDPSIYRFISADDINFI
ncbi:MAG: hypothetical protein FWE36_08695, partial [Erysipelotrichales bacterium]|nr:hypothetical protein [Erysipelotrichales bacterium]